jgi:hypothetical protein
MFRTQVKSLKKWRVIAGMFSIFFLGLLVFSQYVFGATTDFTVQTLVGSDTTPPTVPTGVMATGITTTQIDVSWTASTDDFILSGYHVYRDNVQIATTTGTTYSDTGLTASTTYAYYITSFDSFFNFSASSSVATGTTLSPPPPTPTTTPTTDGPTFGSRIRALSGEIHSLRIVPQQESVTITYKTEGYIRSVIKWGRTSSYELGSLAERSFSTQHETTILGLTPGVLYYFSIEGENKIGRYGTMHSGTFMTLPPIDIFPPSNVRNLTAVREGDDIKLSWVNPDDSDFDKVRVVRSPLFYPSDTRDGWVAYEGSEEEVTDAGSAKDAKKQYYTVFTYDKLGNVSSGAVVALNLENEPTIIDDADPTLNPIQLTFDALSFWQEGEQLDVSNGKVRVDGVKQLTITLPYEKVPEHLKTILVTLQDARDSTKKFSFLLRINKDKTAYTSTLAPFGITGDFPIQVSLFDFVTTQIGYTEGTLSSKVQSVHTEGENQSFISWLSSPLFTHTSRTVVFILLLLALAFMGRRLMLRKY